MRKTLIYLKIILVSSVAALMVAEAAYRLRLVKLIPEQADEQGFNLYDKSPWEFHEKFGYIYPPNRVIAGSNIYKGIQEDAIHSR